MHHGFQLIQAESMSFVKTLSGRKPQNYDRLSREQQSAVRLPKTGLPHCRGTLCAEARPGRQGLQPGRTVFWEGVYAYLRGLSARARGLG